MKKIVAIFSVLAMFSVAVMAQDKPKKNTVKKPVPAATGKTVKKNQVKRAVKANVAPAKINK